MQKKMILFIRGREACKSRGRGREGEAGSPMSREPDSNAGMIPVAGGRHLTNGLSHPGAPYVGFLMSH